MGIQTSSINNGPVAGFKNKFINGNFDYWQRGTSLAADGTSTVRYLADRWLTFGAGTTIAPSRQSFTLGQTDVPNNPKYFHRCVVASVAGAANYSTLTQRIEGVETLAGQQVTVSFWAKADASKPIAVTLSQYFGSGGTPSASVETTCGKVTIGTTWQKVTFTATLPSVSGKTLGTNNNDLVQILIWFDAGSNYNTQTNTLGQQSGTFDIAQVQLEEGPVATDFEQRPQQTELALCQRYFCKTFNQLVDPASNAGQAGALFSTGNTSPTINKGYAVTWYFPATMRAAPSVTSYNPSNTGSGWYTSAGASLAPNIVNIGTQGVVVTNGATAAATGENACIHLTASSEL